MAKQKLQPRTEVDAILVKQLMIAKGWTQQELATAASMSMGTLSRMLNGKPFLSSTLDRLAQTLELDPRDLQKTQGFPAPRSSAPYPGIGVEARARAYA